MREHTNGIGHGNELQIVPFLNTLSDDKEHFTQYGWFEAKKRELNNRPFALSKRTNAHRFVECRHVVFRTHSSAQKQVN